jgi:predicted dehydrogenase
MSSPLRWGILATGGIAVTFTKDLLKDPSTRGVSDVNHTVTAAASSSSASRANDFLKEVGAPAEAKGYGSYAELAKDPNVDIVYVATPHSHHFQNTMLCLEAKKHVLCEKAFTTNAAQARILVDTAKKNNVFLMEAVWIRFFPICKELRKIAADGTIGDVRRVFADLSISADVEQKFGTEHRMVNMDLAGGALLDCT